MGKLIDCVVNVRSTNIEKIAWSCESSLLVVTFHNGGKYVYSKFYEDDLLAFINQKSMGKYFHTHIKQNHECEKLG